MEPYDALARIEDVLRNAIRHALPSWQDTFDIDAQRKLEEKRDAERKRRDGAVSSADLLDYLETYQLTDLVSKNWGPEFKSIFDDKKQFEVFAGFLNDVRNTVAHTRELVPHEVELLSGIAGQWRNQVAMHLGRTAPASRYYPTIESARDSFGNEGVPNTHLLRPMARLDVGQEISVRLHASPARGRKLRWHLQTEGSFGYSTAGPMGPVIGTSEEVDYTILFTDDHVSECVRFNFLLVAESRFHRMADRGQLVDDEITFAYAVNPPPEE